MSRSGGLTYIIISIPDHRLPPDWKEKHFFILSLPTWVSRVTGREGGSQGAEDIGLWDLTPPPLCSSVAVDRLPDFLAAPNAPGGQPLPHHQCSIHLNCEDTQLLQQAFEDAMDGRPSHKWVVPGLCVPWGILTPSPGEGG